MIKCKSCNSKLIERFSFGKMPIANNFLDYEKFNNEFFFEMEISICEKCSLFQLVEQPDKNLMFHNNYKFYSSLSNNMKLHFRNFFNEIEKRFLYKFSNPFILEIGCNDGIFLENFKRFKHLGIDPSENVINLAKNKGLNTKCDFVSKNLFNEIKKNYGLADVITAANVICHIPDINGIFESIETILSKKGIFIFEEPYLGNVYKFCTFDQIYDEHIFLFSLRSIEIIANRFDLEVFDIKKVNTHGGSMRYYLGRKNIYEKTETYKSLVEEEASLGLNLVENFRLFTHNCVEFKKKFTDKINQLKNNYKICAYAATSKSTTLLNFCGIGSNIIDCIFDNTPEKQGLFSPGMHIPVVDSKKFLKKNYDICLLLAYNHSEEIKIKEKSYKGKWLEYYPEIKLARDTYF
jgi:methylation protein EvaC